MTTHPTTKARANRQQRGISHVLHPQVLGAIIAGSGASAFVLINKDALPDVSATLATGTWAVAVLMCAWAVLFRPRHLRDFGPPHPRAGQVYSLSVLGMLAVFLLGSAALKAVDLSQLQPSVVVMAVGLHFVPFAAAFDAKVFSTLGWSIFAIGLGTVLLGLLLGDVYVAAGAVATGILMLTVMAIDATGQGGVRP